MRNRVLLAFLALAASRAEAMEYVKVTAVPGIVEIAFEAPKEWSRSLEPAGEAGDSWKVELQNPDNMFVRINIRKYVLSAKRKGYPVLTVKKYIARLKALQGAKLSSKTKQKTPFLELTRFNVAGDWIQASGAIPPRVTTSEAYFKSGGFLYTVNLSSPEDDQAFYLPVLEHVLKTLHIPKENTAP